MDSTFRKSQSQRFKVFDVDSRVVNPDTLQELPQGEVGEIVTHGPQVFLGYWQRPGETDKAFFEMDGKRYSHVIDPRNGYPVSNGVISVSIVADNCTLADGLATAIMVMGPKGVAVIDGLDNVEGLIVVQTAGGTVQEYASKGFAGNLL